MTNNLSKKEQRQIVEMAREGNRNKDIADAMGRSISTVEKLLARRSVQSHARTLSAQYAKAVVDLHALGYSDVYIASAIGIDASSVAKRRKRLGLSSNCDKSQLIQSIGRARRYRDDMGSRDYRRRSGWPDDIGLTGVCIMNAVASVRLPLTRLSLTRLLGVSSWTINAAVRELVGRQLLALVYVRPLRRGRSPGCYVLGRCALSLLEERISCQQEK